MSNYTSRFYVMLPRYVGQWLRCKYMPKSDPYAPVDLPWLSHPAGRIVYQRAVDNAEIKKLTSLCYSSQMFNMDPGDVPEERQSDFPSNEAMRDFVAIALPAPHYYDGVWITDGETVQLDRKDTHRFIDALLEEFWSDQEAFWTDYQQAWSIKHPGKHCSFYDSVLDFMEFWHIDLDEEEAFYRAVKRRNKANKTNRT